MTNISSKPRAAARVFWTGAALAALGAGVGVYLLLAANAASTADADAAPRATAPLAEFAPARRLDGPLTIAQTGFIRAAAEVAVAAEVAGRIAFVAPELYVGGRVDKGAVLLELQKARFRAEVDAAEARREQAAAVLGQAQSALARQRQLQRRDFASEANLEDAETALARAEADLHLADARLTQARIALDDTTVVAPFDAVVVAEQAAVGQLIQPGQSVGRLVRADAAKLNVGLSAQQAALFGDLNRALERRVPLYATDGDTAAPLRVARVTAVDPALDSAARTSNLVLTVYRPFDSRADAVALRINQLVRAEVPVEPDVGGGAVLTVPPAALKQGDLIWRLDANERLAKIPAQVIWRGEDAVYVVAGGLSDGDRVLVTELDAPFDGQRVRPSDDRDAAPDAGA